MKNREKLIEWYEKRLEKVIEHWENDSIRGNEYIEFAKSELEAVKNGREW